MTNLTSPITESAVSGASVAVSTSPAVSGFGMPAAETVAAVQSGIATRYWIELVAYPVGSTASLWLSVNNVWKRYDNPSAHMSQMVQDAFLGGGTVRVWFNGQVIVGLVVSN